jgi:hypothetical protein
VEIKRVSRFHEDHLQPDLRSKSDLISNGYTLPFGNDPIRTVDVAANEFSRKS